MYCKEQSGDKEFHIVFAKFYFILCKMHYVHGLYGIKYTTVSKLANYVIINLKNACAQLQRSLCNHEYDSWGRNVAESKLLLGTTYNGVITMKFTMCMTFEKSCTITGLTPIYGKVQHTLTIWTQSSHSLVLEPGPLRLWFQRLQPGLKGHFALLVADWRPPVSYKKWCYFTCRVNGQHSVHVMNNQIASTAPAVLILLHCKAGCG